MSSQLHPVPAETDERTDWLHGRVNRIREMEWWRWCALIAVIVLPIAGAAMAGAGALIVLPPDSACSNFPFDGPCDRARWLLSGALLIASGLVAYELAWSRSSHVYPEWAGIVGLVLLSLAIGRPMVIPSAGSRECLGIPILERDQRPPDICLTPELLSSMLLAALFVVGVVCVMVSRTRGWLPDLVVTSFLVLIVGGVWLRDVRSVPSLDNGQKLQLRVLVTDLANGAALVRPGQDVDIVLAGQEDIQQQTLGTAHVLGLYAADGHSVAYTGELPNNILLAVDSQQFDSVLGALTSKKQPAYLQAHTNSTPTTLPLLTSTPTPKVLVPLPRDRIKPFDASVLADNNRVVLVVIDERPAAPGVPVQRDTQLYDAILAGCDSQYVYALLDRGRRDTTVRSVTDQLADIREIYILPPVPATPTPHATSGSAPLPTPEATPQPAAAVANGRSPLQAPAACAQNLLPATSTQR